MTQRLINRSGLKKSFAGRICVHGFRTGRKLDSARLWLSQFRIPLFLATMRNLFCSKSTAA
jgi:hypothetical protein